MKISEFQVKDVVSVSNGKRLGHIYDLEINTISGKIEAIIIQSSGKMMGLFGRDNDLIIPWKNIIKIGTDVILVRLNEVEVNDELQQR